MRALTLTLAATGALLLGTSGVVARSAQSEPPASCLGIRQPSSTPDEFLAVVEIGQGGRVKYEMDLASGRLRADRILPDSLTYPVNYGMLPCTLGGDGDPLDVLVVAPAALLPGSMIRVRVIGVLPMVDGGEPDDKILGVPVADRDSTGDPVVTLSQLPPSLLADLRQFFATYKGAAAAVHLGPWGSAIAAIAQVRAAMSRAARTGDPR